MVKKLLVALKRWGNSRLAEETLETLGGLWVLVQVLLGIALFGGAVFIAYAYEDSGGLYFFFAVFSFLLWWLSRPITLKAFLYEILPFLGFFLMYAVSSRWQPFVFTLLLWIYFWVELWRPYIHAAADEHDILAARVKALEIRLADIGYAQERARQQQRQQELQKLARDFSGGPQGKTE